MFFNNERDQYLEILQDCGLPVNGGGFWTKFPKRAAEEICKLEENTNAILTSCSNSKLIWEEEIYNNFGTYFLISIEVDSGYPFSIPKVFVKDSDIDCKVDIHRYGDGSLCLMHADDYNSNMSILEFRGQACSWCMCVQVYKETGEWPAAEYHH